MSCHFSVADLILIMVMDILCIALFFVRNELTVLYTLFYTASHDDADVHVYIAQSLHAIVAMLCAFGRVLISAVKPAANGRCLVCKSLNTTLLHVFTLTVQKYIYPSVS